jgi:hypothetical protein
MVARYYLFLTWFTYLHSYSQLKAVEVVTGQKKRTRKGYIRLELGRIFIIFYSVL